MKKTEIWCDNSSCGRTIQVKNTPKGAELDFSNVDKSWEIWSPEPEVDTIYCSLPCLIEDAQRMNALEQPLGEQPLG